MSGWTMNDLEPPILGNLSDGSSFVDLAVAVAVVIHIQRPDLTIINRAGIVSNQIVSPGGWSLPLVTGDFPVAGVYKIEAEVEWTVGRKQTFGPVSFNVTGELA